jgi:ribosome biogenesis protein Nip4
MNPALDYFKSKGTLVNRNGKYFLSKIDIRNARYLEFYLGTKDVPSMPACFELAKTSFPRVIISNKAVEKFTRGNDIHERAVVSGELQGHVLVFNRAGDCLGMGVWHGDRVKHLVDVGKFLR